MEGGMSDGPGRGPHTEAAQLDGLAEAIPMRTVPGGPLMGTMGVTQRS